MQYLSAVTVAELLAGLALLPAGRRRSGLQESMDSQVISLFAGRVLPIEPSCTQACADVTARARRAGLAIASADRYIAATAAVRGLTVATRESRPFQAAGVAVVNPWLI